MMRAILCIGLTLAATAHGADGAALYAQGMERYDAGDYRAAYARFDAAADAGHARAQEIAGLMALLAPALYGGAVRHDSDVGLRRLLQAAESGSEVARHVACAYLRRRGGTPRDPCDADGR